MFSIALPIMTEFSNNLPHVLRRLANGQTHVKNYITSVRKRQS